MPLRCLRGWLRYNIALLIKANLVRRKITEDPLYPLMRGIEAEATGHVLWGCPATKDAWNICGSKIQKKVHQA
jgi:hypothetical protein